MSVERRTKSKEALTGSGINPVSETTGRISKIFANLRPSDSPIFQSELAVLNAMALENPTAQVIIGVPFYDFDYPGAREKAEKTKDSIKRGLIKKPVIMEFPIKRFKFPWARDIGFWANGGKKFMVSSEAPINSPAGIEPFSKDKLEVLKEGLGVDSVELFQPGFDGGDLIFTDDAAFVANRTPKLPRFNRPSVRLGKKDLFFGKHLDQSLVFVTNNCAVLNNPYEMLRLLESLSQEEMQDWENKILSLTPEEDEKEKIIKDFKFLKRVPGLCTHEQAMFTNAAYFERKKNDLLRKQLENHGISVIEIPGINALGFSFSSVNSVTETFIEDGEEKRRIYLPLLGLKKYDQIVSEILSGSNLLDKIIGLEIGYSLAASEGGIRCVANVLREEG